MKLLVFGASGQTGRELVRQGLALQHDVTAFVRQPAKLGPLASGVRTIQGNVTDYPAVAAAVAGHEAVVSTLGAGTSLARYPDFIAGVQHIIRAMQAHHVARLIYQSFIGVHESRAAVGVILRYVATIPLRNAIADHEANEALVRASPLDWTIVRPPNLTNGLRTGRYRSGTDITTWAPVPRLARADVADFILQELAHPRFVGQAARLLP